MIESRKPYLVFPIIIVLLFIAASNSFAAGGVVISEIGWSGTKASSTDEWIELYNNTDTAVDLALWGIYEGGESVLTEELTGVIAPHSFYLIERTDDATVADIPASQMPSPWGGSGLANGGEHLVLKNAAGIVVDEINAAGGWFAGSASPNYFSMERIDFLAGGDNPTNWRSNDGVTRNGTDAAGNPINGTPLAANSAGASGSGGEQSGGDQGGDETSGGAGGDIAVAGPEQPAAINKPPIASAGENKLAVAGEKIIFDARASSDPDGDSLSFLWNFGDGATSSSADTFHTYNFPGEYLATLEVSDGKDKTMEQISSYIYPRGIIISEFLPDPEGKDEEGEWIEIFNGSEFVADLAGWQLDDETDGGSKPFTFPKSFFVLPGQYLVISRQTSKISLNNSGGEEVRLILPRGVEVDRIVYEKTKEGYAAVRSGEEVFWSRISTPGFANLILGDRGEIIGGEAIGALIVGDFNGGQIAISNRDLVPAPQATVLGAGNGGVGNSSQINTGNSSNSSKILSAGKLSSRQSASTITIDNTRQKTATSVLAGSIILSAAIFGLYFQVLRDNKLKRGK